MQVTHVEACGTNLRVLWLTNVASPEAGPEFGGNDTQSGGWMWGLADALRKSGSVALGISTACRDGRVAETQVDGISHFRVPISRAQFTHSTQLSPDRQLIQGCQDVVAAFKPDLIHIHGTEETYGVLAAAKILKCPCVISLQGMIGAYLPHYWGGMSVTELLACHTVPNFVLRSGLVFDWWRWRQRQFVEERIIRENRHFIGRTVWDRTHLLVANPKATYHFGDEVLRPEFYEKAGRQRRSGGSTIFAIWGGYPIKGTHLLLKAMRRVRECVPNVQLRLAGGMFKRSRILGGYWSYLDELIRALHLSDCVTLLPRLDAAHYVQELLAANVFALPSFIENSPNSLCEAMLVGTPAVAAFVGGIPSLVTDNETALCFPSGEHAVLAERLISVLTDDALATRLSENARRIALKRHDRQRAADRTVEIYRTVLEDAP